MKKTFIITLVILTLPIFSPMIVSAENTQMAELQTKLKEALVLVASLQAKIEAISNSTTGFNIEFNIKDQFIENKEVIIKDPEMVKCVSINSVLVRGKTDKETSGEVSKLQEFLKSTGDYQISTATGYFGPITEKAVQSWQKRNKLVTTGTAITTGFGVVGPQTRKAILKGCVEKEKPEVPPITNTPYNFKASPERGKAPLTVSFRAKSVSNKFADSYYVDFGDGAESNMVGIAGVCAPGYEGNPTCTLGYNLNVFHTYTTTGKYQATLNEKYSCTASVEASCITLYSTVVASTTIVVE